MKRARRSFSAEFKRNAVEMVLSGQHSLAQVARDLDLTPKMLRRWRKEYGDDPDQAFPGQGRRKADEQEVFALRQEVQRLRQQRDILKKALAIFSEPQR